MIGERRSYVAGTWVDGDETLPVEDPADATVVAEVSLTPPRLVEHATARARATFDDGVWSALAPQDRASVVSTMLDALQARTDDLVDTAATEAGQPVRFARWLHHDTALRMGRAWVSQYLGLPEEEPNPAPLDDLVAEGVVLSFRRHEPIGVVAAITPYNASVAMAIQKVVPALLTGNSVVLRPSPLTPVAVLAIASAAEAAGLPAGVLSVVLEAGSAAAEHLTTCADVDMVSFTGSTAVGRSILAQAAPTVKRVALELGGKAAQLYLPDAVDRAAAGALATVLPTAAQSCVAPSRILVPRERKREVVAAITAAIAGVTVGDPREPATDMGPLISADAVGRCERIVSASLEHGAVLAHGGTRPVGLDRGHYFAPTVLDVADERDPSAREEVFGPVLSVIGYDDLDHAVRIANDTIYGLANQVVGDDIPTALALARRLRSGAVAVNTGFFNAHSPAGGYKQSGLGRERSVEGIRAFQEIKHISVGRPS